MYECLNDFKSQKINKNYKYGDVISEAEYYTLESFERLKFRKDVRHYSEESFHSKNSDIIQSPSFFDNSLNEISENNSSNYSSSSDNSSSTDFGGGSFDGGGAGGDW